MKFTASELAEIAQEFIPAITGMFLNKVLQTGYDEWVFELRKESQKLWLLISVSPENSRVHLLSAKPGTLFEPGSFTKLLKKTVLRSVVSKVEQINEDRIIRFDFVTHDGGFALIAEIMGSRGNLYLLKGERAVAAVALPRKTRNFPGSEYVLPKPPTIGKDAETVSKGERPVSENEYPLNREVEERFRESAVEERLKQAKIRALAPIKAKLKRTSKRIKDLIREKQTLERFANDKKLGDILQANFHKLAKGVDSVEVSDPFSESGDIITIKLDRSKNPAENLKAFYKRYRKYEKGLPRIERELENLRALEAEGRKTVATIESATDIDTISPYIPEKKKATVPVKSGNGKALSGPRRFISSDGYTIFVGRNDRENDELTFRMANGRDLWLHTRDYPGSHVLARLPKGLKGFPQATLKEAAMLALTYSKAAKAGKGEVTYCYAKHVRKPKGAPPGKALVSGTKSIMIKIDPNVIRAMKERVEKG